MIGLKLNLLTIYEFIKELLEYINFLEIQAFLNIIQRKNCEIYFSIYPIILGTLWL